MKILITNDIIKGPEGKIENLYKTADGYITNGEWMLREDLVTLPDGVEISGELKCTSKEVFSQFGKLEYTDEPDFKVIISPTYGPIFKQMDDLENVRICFANKLSPIIFVDFDESCFLGMLMPCISPEDAIEMKKAKSKQELIFMLNNYEKYVEKHDLIPVEYKIEGQEGVCGLFVERNATDEFIKRQIKFAVKQSGGRWLGKFQRKPEDKDKMVKMIVAQMAKVDIAEVQKRALEAEAKVIKEEEERLKAEVQNV